MMIKILLVITKAIPSFILTDVFFIVMTVRLKKVSQKMSNVNTNKAIQKGEIKHIKSL